MNAGSYPIQFPLEDPPGPHEKSQYHSIVVKRFVAVEDEHVRGGYILTHQRAFVEGQLSDLQLIQFPLSEGIINIKYAILGLLLVKDALSRAPMLYGLGMGGLHMPLPKMLKVLGFRMHSVPFWFRVLNAARFLRNIQPLRTTPARRFALDALSYVPLVPRVLPLYHASKARPGPETRGVSMDTVPAFGPWADDLWTECASPYSLVSIRDAATLNWRLSPDNKSLHRIRLTRGGQTIGWVVVTDSQFEGHKQFGSMRVGAIIDALCLPGEEIATMVAGVRYLRERRVDLMVSNQCASVWSAALQRNGFLGSSSNFIFAASPQLTTLISRDDPGFARVHMNRSDGDGPINL